MHFPSAPWTFVESDAGWGPGHSGSSSGAEPLLGFSSLLGPGPIWLGRTGTGTGSTLRGQRPAPLGSLVAWLQQKRAVIALVTPWPGRGWRDPGFGSGGKSCSGKYGNTELATLTGERGVS